jgi:hypothetical protein
MSGLVDEQNGRTDWGEMQLETLVFLMCRFRWKKATGKINMACLSALGSSPTRGAIQAGTTAQLLLDLTVTMLVNPVEN